MPLEGHLEPENQRRGLGLRFTCCGVRTTSVTKTVGSHTLTDLPLYPAALTAFGDDLVGRDALAVLVCRRTPSQAVG